MAQVDAIADCQVAAVFSQAPQWLFNYRIAGDSSCDVGWVCGGRWRGATAATVRASAMCAGR